MYPLEAINAFDGYGCFLELEMTYREHMQSAAWRKKRLARLKLDGYRCRLCDENGSRFRLEVHHRPNSYAKIPRESVRNDLITLCGRCHTFVTATIRADRKEEIRKPARLSVFFKRRGRF